MKTRAQTLIPKVLMCINALIVAALLTMSFIVIYFSSPGQKDFFGHTALIYKTYDDQNLENHSLYMIDINDKAVFVGDEILFNTFGNEWENIPAVDKIVEFNDARASTKGGYVVDIDSEMYLGKVTMKNHALGEKLFTFTSNQTALTLYVAFGGGFVILSLVVILVLAIKVKEQALANRKVPVLYSLDDADDADMEDDYDVEIDLLIEEIEAQPRIPLRLQRLQSPEALEQIFFTGRINLDESIAPDPDVKKEAPLANNSDSDKILDEIIWQAQEEFYAKKK